ncbi:MAG: AAA family ATPase, partial [Pyrinomonadaceae bacterium]
MPQIGVKYVLDKSAVKYVLDDVELKMKFIVIFGPPAVGKMSVGHELAKLTGLRLFHNHMTIDLVLSFFDFGQPQFHRLVSDFRRRVFEEVAASDLPGLIFTFVWALDSESDRAFIERSCDIFRERNAEIYFVELEAELSERLKRNESEFRLSQKPPKRDLEKSRERLLEDDRKHRLNSNGDFFYQENYLKIENTHLPAHEAARRIADA